MPAPASDRNPQLPTQPTTAGQMILPAAQIFDAEGIGARLDAALADETDAAAIRACAVRELGAAKTQGRAAIEEAFAVTPMVARRVTRAYSHLTDGLVTEAIRIATTYLHPNPNPTAAERMAVMAVGGSGRGEMAPFSDVDLLFVLPWKMTGWAESVIESTLYILWDLHLKVGHASRSVADCLRLAKGDFTIRTSLLEMRFLTGDAALGQELSDALRDQLFKSTTAEFIEAKLEERDARHKRQGGQRYMVEPNVKEGKGGLRDLQTLYWIAKYQHGVDTAGELVDLGVFTGEEFAAFDAAERFLWAVRCHLHLLTAGRRTS